MAGSRHYTWPLHTPAPQRQTPPQTLELLLSHRHLKPGLLSSTGETASEVARRSGPHHFLFEIVEDCVNVSLWFQLDRATWFVSCSIPALRTHHSTDSLEEQS
ncbi:unnamed protein product [Pleuronectes platessa]|uniref:Uncharacterized protein n=1 Tax=Pleuronectes platessa TaxID=8262 RepID=A0A9N7UYM0_PLEPL|nr:unnamed protein product [Pleuronectes platessa]